MKQAKVTVGVYRPFSPLATLPSERVQALCFEADRQGVSLYFFDASDVQLETETITATVVDEAGRAMQPKMKLPFPDVVLNEWPVAPQERPEVEKELRKRVPFTTHLIHSKLDVQRLLDGTLYRGLLLPASAVESFQQLQAFLLDKKQIILKPMHGRRGDSISCMRIRDGKVQLRNEGGELEISFDRLEETYAELVKDKPLLMQQYWPYHTELDEPVDYRAHVQRDQTGQWQLTKLYPRIGYSGSIVSNISKGGRTEDIELWLTQIYSEGASAVKQRLAETAMGLAECINRFYPFLIDELGIDLLMDEGGSIRFLEANSGPETRFHETKRAIHTIGFARYLAEVREGHPSKDDPLIGMLTPAGDSLEEKLREACAYVAKGFEAEFYYFHVEDVIFFPFPFVKGYRLRQGKWESRYMPYPDVIYDRLKGRGKPKYEAAYSVLREIPSTEERSGGSYSKLKLYMLLQSAPSELSNHLIPFTAITDSGSALTFLVQHGTVVIKPSGGSHGDQIAIVKKENQHYWVQDPEHAHRLGESEFQQLLEALTLKEGILAQKFIRSVTRENLPFHIRIHLIRGVGGGWVIVGYMPYLSTNPGRTVVNHSSGLRVYTKWDWFLDYQYPGRQAEMEEQVSSFAMQLAEWLDRNLEERITELGIDIGMDENEHLWLFEANMNRVGVNNRELEVAKHIIPLALNLLKGADGTC